jgi:hypothetical protein
MAAIMAWVDLPRAAFALSVAAICISALSLCLTWRRDRRSERAGYSLVELHVMPFPIEPGVHAVMLAVTNREEHRVYLKNFRVLRPRGAAFVGHREDSNNTDRPTIFRDQRSRIRVKYVCLFERGTPGAHWGQTRYLDVGSIRRRAITIRFKLEFDFVDTSGRRIYFQSREATAMKPRRTGYDTSFRNVWTGPLSDVLESDLNRRSSGPHRQGDPMSAAEVRTIIAKIMGRDVVDDTDDPIKDYGADSL